MAAWTQAAARGELRTLLSDGDTDKLAHRKKVFGKQDGVNLTFKTLEFRRVGSLVSLGTPQGVFIDNQPALVLADDLPTGEFILDRSNIPLVNQDLRATYFYQWFTDSELDNMLLNATRFIMSAEDLTVIPMGLRQATLQYAAFDAYQKLASRWAQRLSDVYRVEDSLDNDKAQNNPFLALSKDCRACAMSLRDDFYKKQGQQFDPAFATISGNVREVVPPR